MWEQQETSFYSKNLKAPDLTSINISPQKNVQGKFDLYKAELSMITEQDSKALCGAIKTVVMLVVDFPDKVDVRLEQGEQTLVLRLYVEKSDIGKVIGKNGKMAECLRTLLSSMAARRKIRAVLSIEE